MLPVLSFALFAALQVINFQPVNSAPVNTTACNRPGDGTDCPYRPLAKCFKTYTVMSGDTLEKIAKNFGWTSAKDLIPLNTGLDVEGVIYPGNTLCVCEKACRKNAELGTCPKTYTFKAGDECMAVAIKNNQQGPDPTAKLLSLNKRYLGTDINCDNLQVGQQVCVQCTANDTANTGANDCPFTPVPGCTKNHTIVSGDELNKLAVANGLTNGTDLARLNRNLDPELIIYPDNVVCVAGPMVADYVVNATNPKGIKGCLKVYTSVKGDTCESIAIKYDFQGPQPGDKVRSLNEQLNNTIKDCNNLKIGTSVCVDTDGASTKISAGSLTIPAGQANLKGYNLV
ncbi:hypothetical protein SeMB42_g06967 [Synchytrium endobioticum]|uniref:LysM domain-containing protein n=1 Tax=Synchytrium endobioticum TaxID=286115 RepID=A0A507BXQ4_9FUNG|nr:hypothetical protein SeMB42_g07385 [Synchytrium endobioticum]TPX36481.1 hypothetical protein SeLEV6574_g08022 [Synchytrium endobioticum]TPX37269.1 hypothetical protein SeMB42_g06967 [Synchytrium endobioticum]